MKKIAHHLDHTHSPRIRSNFQLCVVPLMVVFGTPDGEVVPLMVSMVPLMVKVVPLMVSVVPLMVNL